MTRKSITPIFVKMKISENIIYIMGINVSK